MFTSSIIKDMADFILSRISEAEKMFAHRIDVKSAYITYDEAYNEINEVLKKSNQEHLLKTLQKSQVDYNYWLFKAIYIQALMDMYHLFHSKD